MMATQERHVVLFFLLVLHVSSGLGQDAKCQKALGAENMKLPDKAFSAATIYSATWAPAKGRLNFKSYCYLAKANDVHQWLAVSFGSKGAKITKVATMGRPGVQQYVKTYTLSYSLDGVSFEPYKRNGRTAIFQGNTNPDTVKSNTINPPIIARKIRFNVQTWHSHIALRVELYGCTEGVKMPDLGCAKPLGVESKLPAKAFSASSILNLNYLPDRARLNNQVEGSLQGSWCARNDDKDKYIKFDFGKAVKIVKIATQGKPAANNYFVKKYSVFYGMDMFDVKEYGRVLDGNVDRDHYAVNKFGDGIIARYVFLSIKEYSGYACMRVEFYGCETGFTAPAMAKCLNSLGMENGQIPDTAIRASSEYNANYRASDARLNFNIHNGHYFGWLAKTSNAEQWLSVTFSKWTQIAGIETQGRGNAAQWVSSYTLASSYDGVDYTTYKQNGRTALFQGNKDNYDVVGHKIIPNIITRSIRILPQHWNGNIAMRVEFSGCTEGVKIPDVGCTLPLGMGDGRVQDTAITASSVSGTGFQPANARLNKELHDARYGAWCTAVNNDKQFLLVDFGKAVKAVKIATQGRHDADQWVKSYTISYSQDGIHFTDYDRGTLFLGNKNRNFYSVNKFIPPIIARYIRINPKSHYGKMCMRAEFFGCDAGSQAPKLPTCKNALGLQNKVIEDRALSASSELSASYLASQARLYYNLANVQNYGWLSKTLDINQWLQVTFVKWTEVSGVATQGRGNGNNYIKSYTISYSYDTVFFDAYKNNGRTKVFQGNTDSTGVVYHDLEPTQVMNALRINPQSWQGHIGLRMELYGCTEGVTIPKIDCALPLGMQSKVIPDKALTASTVHGAYDQTRARLRMVTEGAKKASWRAGVADKGQWLQVDFGSVAKITGIATQGDNDNNWWVTEYTLSYSLDGGHYEPYKKEFQGNANRNMIVAHRIAEKPIYGRFARIHPTKWSTVPSLRMEFFGCREGFTVPPMPKCQKALGMQSGKIAENQLKASSQYNANFAPKNGRLHLHAGGANGNAAWGPKTSNKFQWLQVDLKKATKITRVSTQGRQDAAWWTKSYSLSFSLDGVFFEDYQIKGETKVFAGNTDYLSVVSHPLDPPIISKFIRINPITWQGHISLRVEFFGCTTGFMPPNPADCRAALGMQNGGIKDASLKASSTYSASYVVTNGRLKSTKHCWSPKTADAHQWLQADLSKATKITGIATQGRADAAWWLTSYYLTYSQDGLVFDNYEEKKEFYGNLDNTHVVAHIIKPAIVARFIRVVPKTWNGHPALRVEFFGCKHGFIAPPPPSCVDVMGLEKGWVPNNCLTASSSVNSGHGPYNARLNFIAGSGRTGGWSAGKNDKNQWLQVDFERMMLLSRVAVQGRQESAQWVKTYTLTYSLDGRGKFESHMVNNKIKVFDGNWDKDTVVISSINPEVVAQYVKIHPQTWHSHISMRAEFWGCEGAVPIITTPVITVVNKKGRRRKRAAAGSMAARCDFDVRDNPIVPGSPSAKYELQWVVNGEPRPIIELGSDKRYAELPCGEGGFKAGDDVICKVRGKFDAKDHWSSYRPSQNFDSGITVDPTKITVSEGSLAATVNLNTNLPMCCDDPKNEDCMITLEFEHMDEIVTDKCQIQLRPGMTSTSFKVRAIRDFLDDGDKSVDLRFKPINAPHCPCWHGYTPPPIKVDTVDATHQTCSSGGDPHASTFDHQSYHQLRGGGGTFVFVKSLAREFEVHNKVHGCWRVLCNCGVAVRENNDILVYDQCGGVPRVVQKSTGPLSKGVSVTRSGNSYKLAFPSGAEVHISAASWGISLQAKVPGIDRENTIGLCGNNNGNRGDDMDGKSLYTWINSLRVPSSKSLFTTIPPKSPQKPEEQFDCECKKDFGLAFQQCGINHSGEQEGTKLTPIAGDGGGIVAPNANNNQNDDNLKRVYQDPATWPTASGITQAQARAKCKEELQDSEIGQKCTGIGQDITSILEGCLIDIQMVDMLDFIEPSYDMLLQQCKDAILRNPANYANGTNEVTSPILNSLCPAKCSGHGKCHKAKCTCDKGFYENDCSKDIKEPPVLKSMLAQCDVKQWACKQIGIVGDGYVDYEKLTCHFQTYKFVKSKWVSDKSTTSPATYNSFREVICNLPIEYALHRKFAGPIKIEIAVSNNGVKKSNIKKMVVFDSNCFACDENAVCTKKKNNCVIGNICYVSGEKNPADEKYVCDPSKGTSSWFNSAATTAAPTQAPTQAPTKAPTAAPTNAPTQAPTQAPTKAPTQPPLKHRLVGCFRDDWDRALPVYVGLLKTPDACMAGASAKGYKIFSLQHGGECWSGPNGMETYDKHGKSSLCKGGQGGSFANSVYFISRSEKPITVRPSVTFTKVGCYNDARDRGLPVYIPGATTVEGCFLKAKKMDFKAFALQNQGECWSGKNAHNTYSKHGKSGLCKNGKGGPWSNDVYTIQLEGATQEPVTEYISKALGCFKDTWARAVGKYLGEVTSVGQCNKLARDNGGKVFGVQNGKECWSAAGAEKTYKKHGSSDKCKNGKGGPWSNDVYKIQVTK